MSVARTVENFPKDSYSGDDVAKEAAIRLRIGASTSVITETPADWVLTSEYLDEVSGPAAPAATASPVQQTTAAANTPAPDASSSGLGQSLQAAIQAGLRLNEISNASPYKLSFASKGKSGASFGFMQGDLHAGGALVSNTFSQVLAAAGVGQQQSQDWLGALSVPLFHNPLSPNDTSIIDAALNAPAGVRLIDTMDQELCSGVLSGVADCLTTARNAGRQADALATIYMALWINMSGPPTTLKRWLAGTDVVLSKPVHAPGPVVDGDAMEAYLRATNYFVENPQNWTHMAQSAAGGMSQLRVS